MKTPDQYCLNWIKKYLPKRNRVIFDVGANIGQFAWLAKTMSPKAHVYCFEPNTYQQLAENISHFENIHIIPIAVGHECNFNASMFIPEKSPALGSLLQRPIFFTWHEHAIIEKQITMATLDNFCENNNITRIDYLKIDVEGYELNVLKGTENMMKKGLIRAGQFEFGETFRDAGVTLKEVVNFLNSNQFLVFEGNIEEKNLINASDVIEDYRWENFLFLRKDLY